MTPEFYVVGGAVRDVLLGKTPTDIDYLVVGADPEWMLANGFTQVGADFPVFLKNGEEYALARTERKTGSGYHGFTTNWAPDITVEQDLERRDLTVNSIAVELANWPAFHWLAVDGACPEHLMKTYAVGATDDILDRVVRANSGAFTEDPLRVFRAARFAVTLEDGQWTIAADTLQQMKNMVASDDFKALTKERVVQEVIKAASKCKNYQQFSRFLSLLDELGALPTVFSEAGRPFMSQYNEDPCVPVTANEAVGMLMLSRRGTVKDAVAALREQKYPTETIDFAQTLTYLVDEFVRNDQIVSGERLLAAMSAIKHVHFYAATVFMLRNSMFAGRPGLLAALEHALFVWLNTGFSELSAEQQETLTGKDIGLAIRGIKLEKLNDYVTGREC